MRRILRLFLVLAGASWVGAATFGTAVPITGGATDLVLDEGRGRLYIVNSTQNRIDVYSLAERKLGTSIPTGTQPLAAALSRSGKYLYVTIYGTSSLEIVDLDAAEVVSRVSLPAAPEGVAVGGDEGVLITTVGTSSTSTDNRLLRYDPGTGALLSIASTLPAAGAVGTISAGQIYNGTRSHLVTSADGRTIIGLNNATTSTRTVFVYETASASVLRSRTVSNISAVLSVSPDGSRFMAGLSLFDSATLAIVAQQNTANSLYPFASNVNFSTQANQGGSVFAPDGSVLYTAFNLAAVSSSATTTSAQLMLNDPDHMLIKLGIQLPENLLGKMVISSNGANIYALSQSGFMSIPVSTIYDNPILTLDSTVGVLTYDQCGVTSATRKYQVTAKNAGKGRMTATAQVYQNGVTFSFPIGGQTGGGGGTVPGGGGPGGGAGGGGPGQGVPIVLPGGGSTITIPPGSAPGSTGTATTTQQNAIAANAPTVTARLSGGDIIFEFTFNSKAATSLGTSTPVDFLISSPEAINLPPRVRLYQNNRNAEATGAVVAAPISISTAEALVDIVADSARNRLYISNSGLNRVEIFDTTTNQFLTPIKVGQLPRSLALAPGGNLLYVANSGGESISIIDLDAGQVTGTVKFPPLPYNASLALNTPSVIAAGLAGLQIIMSDGTLWKVVNNEAVPRPSSSVISSTLTAPRTMLATPGGEYIVLLAGNGVAYLYDAISDSYVLSQQATTSTSIQGYYGAIAAGAGGQYFVINGKLLNQSLVASSTSAASSTTTVSAVAAVDSRTFARFVQPARNSTSATVTTSPAVELVDTNTGMTRASVAALEGPLSSQVGTARVNVAARTMAVDAAGTTAYLLTTSGLSVVPLGTAVVRDRPSVNQNGIVSTASYQGTMAAGSMVSIFGQNLASSATPGDAKLPTTLGNSCVTIDNAAAPLLMTSPTQINLQLPFSLTAAKHTVVVRALDRNTTTSSQTITVSKYAPAVYVDPASGQAAIYHMDGRPVTREQPANRDEQVYLLASGLGATTGGTVTTGSPSPSDPLAVTQTVKVFFGDKTYKQAEMIVEWSGLAPGMVGIYQITVRVPGERMHGDALPVTVRIGGVDSPLTGPLVPMVAVD